MFQMGSKTMMRALSIVMLAAFIPAAIASAAQTGDNRNTGSNWVNTDGSTTVYPIIEVAAQQFPAAFPGENIGYDAGNGTGSGHGRQALLSQIPIQSGNSGGNEPLDVALASSGCGASDQFMPTVSTFTEAAFTSSSSASPLTCNDLTDVQIAKDAITILVNQTKANCILGTSHPYITTYQVLSIWGGLPYTNESTNPTSAGTGAAGGTQHTWNDFWSGCGSENIVPTSRVTASGTRSAFLDFTGLKNFEPAEITATGLSRFQANTDVENDIANNASHMGYTGMAFDSSKTYQLALAASPSTTSYNPDYSHVANGQYPYSRSLHYYYRASTSKQATKDLASWLLSSASQGNIKKQGFVAGWDASPQLSGAAQPAPDWDVNSDHTANILDVTSIGAYFLQTGPASGDPNYPTTRGWVRADVNYDAVVNILDITTFGPHWAGTW